MELLLLLIVAMDTRTSSIVEDQLDRLAAFPRSDFPVISLYLDTRADQHGKDNFDPFVRKELPLRARTYRERSPERESFERDAERIREYLRDETVASSNAVAIFACAGQDGFFQALQLAAGLDQHELYVGPQPHLYPLARLYDQYRRYAVLLTDTNYARLYVFGVGKRLGEAEISNSKTRRTQAGGWSQARFQRHVDNYHLQHVKEIVERLERVVRDDRIGHVILAGDEVVLPMIRKELPAAIASLVTDELKLETGAPESDVLEATLDRMHEQDARSDQAKVSRLLDQYRAGGLAVVGAQNTLMALAAGQVNELLLSAQANQIVNDVDPADAPLLAPETPLTHPPADAQSKEASLAETLAMRARQTGARTTFIEDPSLLAGVGGVGAFLRFRI